MSRASLVVLLALPAFAGSNSPEKGQRRAEEEVLPKLKLLCGVPLAVRYDGESLKEKNKDIGWDQTDGANQCDEPLRYLWALCQSDAGKAAVRRAELREVVCRGASGETGSLTVKNGVITVERATDESQPHLRSRAQFEQALKVKLTLATEDPYYDEAWHAFRRAPAPVTSTTDYCVVNGNKVAFDWMEPSRLRDGTVKCIEAGVVVADVRVKDCKKTGFTTWVRGDHRSLERLVDGQRDGLNEEREGAVLLSQTMYRAGERVWSKDFHPSGRLKSYQRQLPGRLVQLELTEDGRVTSLGCDPQVKDDDVLQAWCGFGREKTVAMYDGTEKVSRTVTFRDGLPVKQVAGDSPYASGSTVAFVDGKKDGEERVTRRDGTLQAVVTWKRGVQHGRAQRFSDDGKKVVEESQWSDGELSRRTEYFLNGNPKRVETFDGPKAKRVVESYDLGQTRSEGAWVKCNAWRGWCEDGLHVEYFENGQRAAEVTWKNGQREGAGRSWFPSGRPASEDEYREGKLFRRRTWDEDGGVTADDEYEADGSRKLKK